jgi:hypothetical protein
MDAIGFALATVVLATAFTVFGIIDRLLVGLASELRYTIAPGIANGMRAWGRGSAAVRAHASPGADDQPPDRSEGMDQPTAEAVAPAPTVSVRPVTRHMWLRFARLPHAPSRSNTTRIGA